MTEISNAQDKTPAYHPLLKLVHWLMAVMIIAMLASGIYMEGLPKSDFKYEIYGWHKSFGVLILGLIFIRIILRFSTDIPALPKALKSWEKRLSHFVHMLLYIGMIMIPLSGYIMSDAGGYGVKMFGIVMPDFFITDKSIGGFFHSIHSFAPYFIILLVLHIAGVVKHRYLDKGEADILPRMLPNCSGRPKSSSAEKK